MELIRRKYSRVVDLRRGSNFEKVMRLRRTEALDEEWQLFKSK